MYTFVEYVAVVTAALVVAALFFGVAMALISLREWRSGIGHKAGGEAMVRQFTANKWWPAVTAGQPIKFDKLAQVPTQNPEVRMNKKWINLSSQSRDDQKQGQQPDGGGRGPESAPHPDPEPGLAVLAEVRPGANLLESYRDHQTKRTTEDYNIYKIAEMLQSEHIRALPRAAKRAAVLLALQAAGVKMQDVIDDAVQRKEGLDNAARSRESALADFETRKEQVNRKLQVMIESLVAEYDARIQRNNEEVTAERDKFAEWKLAKIQEERKIDEAVSYLIDDNGAAE